PRAGHRDGGGGGRREEPHELGFRQEPPGAVLRRKGDRAHRGVFSAPENPSPMTGIRFLTACSVAGRLWVNRRKCRHQLKLFSRMSGDRATSARKWTCGP